MHESLLRLLVCPDSGSPLQLEDAVCDARGDIERGRLVSANGSVYPIRDGIPHFVDGDGYVSTFSLQRRCMGSRFAPWQDEPDRDQLFERSTGLVLQTQRGALVLDAGCGYGRFLEPVANAGATVVGIDLSADSILLARRFLGNRESVHLVRGDLMRPPFPPAMFDAVYSIGVLQYTPSTRDAFLSLTRFVKPGGPLSIRVYAPQDKKSDDRWRRVTVHLPASAVMVTGLARHVVGEGVRRLLGRTNVAVRHQFWPRVMSQFNSLAPPYASSHTFEEVEQWFEQAGFVDVQRLPRRIAVTGRRPLV